MTVMIENVRKIVLELRSASISPEKIRSLSLDIAGALDWGQGSTSVKMVQVDSGTIHIAKGLLGLQPAAVFAVGTESTNGNLFNEAALYAYHASVPWGVIANKEGALIFNSHWVRRNNWFSLPLIRWNSIEESVDILKAITPEGISQGQIERIATKIYEPDRFLLPVDDALVERLDYWRAETFRFSRSIAGIDEELQTLFAQLFILRVIEDRNIAPNLPSLRSLSSLSGEVNVDKLSQLLQEAQKVIGSELFEAETLKYIPENVLGGIINDLYIPYNLPYGGSRYNFSWIDTDVLGLAYEKYLSTILTPTSPPAQLSLFDQPVRDVERISVRKSSGVYYTPKYLVRYLTERSFDHLNNITDLENFPKIADFACGSGSFLVAACDALIYRLRKIDATRNWARELVNGKHIIGIDNDERAVTLARLALWLRFAEEPQPLPLPRLEEIIVHGDSLSNKPWTTLPETYDIILGNPPFIATGRTTSRDELSARFRTAQGRYDYSYLFVELAINRLKPGGVLSMVVPNRIFRNRDANTIRDMLTSETKIGEILDFGSNEVFEGTSAYIGAIVAKRSEPETQSESHLVRVINILDISSQFLLILLLNAAKSTSEIRNETVIAYNVSDLSGGSPWILVSPSAKRTRTRLENISEPLSTIAGIYQGIRTGANDIFMVTIESEGEGFLARVVNGLGESAIIETTLLHPVVFGSDIQKYDLITSTRYLIYPYRNNTVILEQELRSSYPRTYQYLLRYQDILTSRGSIESSGLRWYELVRKRDENWLQSSKLLIRDLATETSFAVDEKGDIYLVGGTAVVPADPDILMPLLAYLNSTLVNQYLSQITPLFKRNFQKFEPQHLQRIPVPNVLISDTALLDRLTSQVIRILEGRQAGVEGEQRAGEQEIEKILFDIIGLDEQGLF